MAYNLAIRDEMFKFELVFDAEIVLNTSTRLGRQGYGYKDGKMYEFQSDNVGGWLTYPFPYKNLGKEPIDSVIFAMRSFVS